jgi:hypothetical protein
MLLESTNYRGGYFTRGEEFFAADLAISQVLRTPLNCQFNPSSLAALEQATYAPVQDFGLGYE